MRAQRLNVDSVRLDGGTQPRAMLDGAVIAEYAEAMEDGKQFPPVTVFYDGSSYWLADGFHRVNAALQIGRGYVEAQIITGTQRDAVLYSVGANAAHGLRRSNADKRRAVERLLRDDVWRSGVTGRLPSGAQSPTHSWAKCGASYLVTVTRWTPSAGLCAAEPNTP